MTQKESKLTWLVGIYLQITIMLRMIKSVSAVLMPMKLKNASLTAIGKILVGRAPCLPFSKYSQNNNNRSRSLLEEFAEFIRESRPDFVSTENVTSLPKYRNGSVFEQFLDVLRDVGYKVDWSMVYFPDYGVRQSRTRRVLLATLSADPPQLEKTHIPSEFVL